MNHRLRTIILILFFIYNTLVSFNVHSFKIPRESWYQKVWCEGKNGNLEVRMSSGTRVDCLTTHYAIEMDFAQKWHEAIGQALDYGRLSKKKSGIVLILKSKNDEKYWVQLQKVIEFYQLPIKTWKLYSEI